MVFNFEEYSDPLLLNNTPYAQYSSDKKCVYCSSKLSTVDIIDYWEIDTEKILGIHKKTTKEYKEIYDLKECYLNLNLNEKIVKSG